METRRDNPDVAENNDSVVAQVSGRLAQLDHRQVSSALEVRHIQSQRRQFGVELIRNDIGWTNAIITVLRCPAVERLVWPRFIVPINVAGHFLPKNDAPKRHEDKPSMLALERANEPFDDGDGAILAHSPIAGLDLLPLAPFSEVLARDAIWIKVGRRRCGQSWSSGRAAFVMERFPFIAGWVGRR